MAIRSLILPYSQLCVWVWLVKDDRAGLSIMHSDASEALEFNSGWGSGCQGMDERLKRWQKGGGEGMNV